MGLLGLLTDTAVAALLGVTIVYCFRLDRRLAALRSGQDGLKDVIAALDRATERAQGSLGELKSLGMTSQSILKSEIDKAETLIDELKLMVQSADRVADRLAQVRPASTAPAVAPPPQKPAPAKEGPAGPIFDALRQAR
jgi:hypothetical protein